MEASVRFLLKEKALFKQARKRPWLGRGIGIKIGEVVAFAPARATGGIERLLALAAWRNRGEDMTATACAARRGQELGIAKGGGRRLLFVVLEAAVVRSHEPLWILTNSCFRQQHRPPLPCVGVQKLYRRRGKKSCRSFQNGV